MATEALVSSLLTQLVTLITQDLRRVMGVNKRQLQDLLKTLEPVGVLIRDAEERISKERMVKDWLDDVKVLCIVGMGGIGKTTLAQLIYDDDQVKSHFDLRIWVYVSYTFNLQKIVSQIVEAVTRVAIRSDDHTSLELDSLLHKLKDSVKQRRFLLVLDDVWNESIEKWEALKISLSSGAKGSSILVTTRNRRVAYLTSTTNLHQLGFLSDKDSWDLFRGTALIDRDEEELKMFEDIGSMLIRRCHGLPLAVKVLAGLLRFRKTIEEWVYIRDSEQWMLPEMEGVERVLHLAYYNLPSPLKRCFIYTSIFPEDHPIEKDSLIKLWMAQGFVGSSTGRDADLEMVGEEYFYHLVMRSLLQVVRKDKDDKGTHCKMHDLVRDFALWSSQHSVMEITSAGGELTGNKVRHLSISEIDFDSIPLLISKQSSNLRTLDINNCKLSSQTVSPELFSHLKCLRALDLSFLDLEIIPSEIGRLIHLQYGLGNVKSLAEASEAGLNNKEYLRNLVLDFRADIEGEVRNLECVLEGLQPHPNLEKLSIEHCPVRMFPSWMASDSILSNLRLLRLFRCKILELPALGKLPSLKELYMERLDGIKRIGSEFYGIESGDGLEIAFPVLEELHVSDMAKLEQWDFIVHNEIIMPCLRGFSLRYCTKLSSLPHIFPDTLTSLCIIGCERCTDLPALGKLPSLQKLYIQGLDGVEDMGNEFYGIGSNVGAKIAFPALEILLVGCMVNLVQWDFNVQDEKIMPCLRDLSLYDCPKLRSLPHILPDTLQNLRIDNCPELPSSTSENLKLQGVKVTVNGEYL